MTDKLKPCPNPWCDARRPPVLVWDLYRRHVQCDCGVRGPSSDHRSLDGVPHDVINAEAITAWNTRADAAEQRVATLEAALPAVYRLALEDAAERLLAAVTREYNDHRDYRNAIRALPIPTLAELMARIQTGEKK